MRSAVVMTVTAGLFALLPLAPAARSRTPHRRAHLRQRARLHHSPEARHCRVQGHAEPGGAGDPVLQRHGLHWGTGPAAHQVFLSGRRGNGGRRRVPHNPGPLTRPRLHEVSRRPRSLSRSSATTQPEGRGVLFYSVSRTRRTLAGCAAPLSATGLADVDRAPDTACDATHRCSGEATIEQRGAFS